MGYSCTLDDNLPAYNFYYKDTTTPGGGYTNFTQTLTSRNCLIRMTTVEICLNGGLNTGYGECAMLNYKFLFADINNMLGDVIMMRVAEMYLIKAEAAAHNQWKNW